MHPVGSVAAYILNYCAVPQKYTISFSKILALNSSYDNVQLAVRDVWSRTDNGTASGSLALTVPAYDSVLLKLSRLSDL
jgi:hypothetical protein|eukprot:COSAG02_NODE_1604_length_11728_cov_42.819417_9_plen_79_part_00